MRALVVVAALTGCRVNFDRAPTDAGGDSSVADGPNGIAAVQVAQAMSAADVSTIEVAFPVAPATGNTIVAYLWTWTSIATIVAADSAQDSYLNTFQLAAGHFTATGMCAAGTGGAAIFVAPAITASAGPYIVKVSPGGDAVQQLALTVVEYAGLSATPLKDATAMETSGPSPLAFGTGTVVTEPDTLVVSVATECGGWPELISWTSSFEQRGIESRTASVPPGIAGDRLVSTAGTFAESVTVQFSGGDTVPAVGVVAALR